MGKSIIILASSVKNGGVCVAGKDTITKEWIRIVGNDDGRALIDQEDCYFNQNLPVHVGLLDGVECAFSNSAPLINQPENWVKDPAKPLKLVSRHTREALKEFLDSPESLWGNGDRVDHAEITYGTITVSQSLYLIAIPEILIRLVPRRHGSSKLPQIRGLFDYGNFEYDLAVTDPRLANLREGPIDTMVVLSNKYLCISLGEPFHGSCYKLIAAII